MSKQVKKPTQTGEVLNPFEHAFQRPDAVIGSKATVKKLMYVFNSPSDSITGEGDDLSEASGDSATEEGCSAQSGKNRPLIIQKKIKYNQGLLRIFIEAMSNAIDNLWRSSKHDIKMKKIDFVLDNDPESDYYGWITITNDGYCIPIEKIEYKFKDQRTKKVRKEMLYPAEVFFGEMHAGTNFEDDNTRKTSGRNGMGAKAVVIFSKEAIIEHTNPTNGKKFVQNYRENGTDRDKPTITSCKTKTGYTSISFLPDYAYFSYPDEDDPRMDEDFFVLMKRYVYEASMITGLPVTLNGEKIMVKDLSKYVRLYYPNVKENCMMAFKAPNGDECVLIERTSDASAEDDISQVSWVNGINTINGGIHVEAWKSAILPSLVKAFNARKPKKGQKAVLKATAKEIYPYLTLFVRAEAVGAMFDAQPKNIFTELPGNVKKISLCGADKNKQTTFNKLVTENVKKILKWNFVELLEEKLAMKIERTQVKKEGTTKKRIAFGDVAEEANFAGTKRSGECTLWVTEGKSAKTFAKRIISGIPNGTDFHGVFALRGKFLNVTNASAQEIRENKEMQIFKNLMRLVTGVDYNDPEMRKTLKYGKIMIAADQDDDGFHIRGLFLLCIWKLWPSLFDLVTHDGKHFVCSISTAVVMARSGKGGANVKMFYSNPEFKAWYETQGKVKGVSIKYYKGLGSHEPSEAKLYNQNLKSIEYTLDGEEEDYMDLGFRKDQANSRKTWITRDMIKPGEMLLSEEPVVPITIDGELSLSSFVDTQLIIYHKMVLRRALPNIYDGFKESQRKAFYGILMDRDARQKAQNLENLAGSVKKLTGYHHGGSALEDTMKKMAQGFVNSNNIPLLTNEGEYGSRSAGGKDASAARYISTRLEEITWVLFSSMDEPLLKHMHDDDQKVEFEFFMPILPLILINGANGIASGYSTEIPCYNPEDLVKWIQAWIKGETDKLKRLVPWYRGFIGKIELIKKVGKSSYTVVESSDTQKPTSWRSTGILEEGKKGWWKIRELPIGMWTDSMKEYLEYLWTGEPPAGSKKKKADKWITDTPRWKGTANTAIWDFKPVKDFTPEISVSGKFKNMQTMFSLTNMHVIDENNYPHKYFSPEDLLKDFCVKRLEYYGRRKKYWTGEYQKQLDRESDRYKYVKAVIEGKLAMKQEDAKLEAAMIKLGLRKVVAHDDSVKSKASFDYLLSMQMRSIMSANKLEEIKKEVERIKALLLHMKTKTPEELWQEDLDTFKIAYAKFLKTRKEE